MYFSPGSNTTPPESIRLALAGFSAPSQRLRSQKLVVPRYPASQPSGAGLSDLHPEAVPPALEAASGRLHRRPVRTLEPCSSK